MPALSLLVDTNVVSELVRSRPNAGVQRWSEGVVEVALSAITVEEIHFGLAWHPNARVDRRFAAFLRERCEGLPVTEPFPRAAGLLRSRLASQGHPRTQADLLIAATAQVHGLTPVTRNEKDFAGLGVAVLNPFS